MRMMMRIEEEGGGEEEKKEEVNWKCEGRLKKRRK
jgi:hypothetical protein